MGNRTTRAKSMPLPLRIVLLQHGCEVRIVELYRSKDATDWLAPRRNARTSVACENSSVSPEPALTVGRACNLAGTVAIPYRCGHRLAGSSARCKGELPPVQCFR